MKFQTLFKEDEILRVMQDMKHEQQEIFQTREEYQIWLEKTIREIADQSKLVIALLEEVNGKNVIVGYFIMEFFNKYIKIVKMNTIYILPQFRHQGYASVAMSIFSIKLLQEGYSYVYTKIPHKKHLINLLMQLNFTCIGNDNVKDSYNKVYVNDLACKRNTKEIIAEAKNIYKNFND